MWKTRVADKDRRWNAFGGRRIARPLGWNALNDPLTPARAKAFVRLRARCDKHCSELTVPKTLP